jgi:catechol 2,3-dioxygenase-like lactoylglutathione lyase family enzyme
MKPSIFPKRRIVLGAASLALLASMLLGPVNAEEKGAAAESGGVLVAKPTGAPTDLMPGIPRQSVPELESALRRDVLVVADMDRSVAFYQNVFGMKRYYDRVYKTNPDDEYLPLGEPLPRTHHFVIMKGSHPQLGMIALWQSVDPPLPAPADPYHRFGIGDTVRVIQINHIAPAYEKAVAYGGKIYRPLHEGNIVAGDGITRLVKSFFVYDPDGYLIEVNERVLPAALLKAAQRAAAASAAAAAK